MQKIGLFFTNVVVGFWSKLKRTGILACFWRAKDFARD